MKRSDHRILTTHAGRLDGPPELMKLSRDVMAGRVADVNALRPAVQRGIVDVIRRQAGAGVDVISDGEVGKFGFGSLAYYGRRLSGLMTRPLKPGEAPFMALETNECFEFAEFYKDFQFFPAPRSHRLQRRRHLYRAAGNPVGHPAFQVGIGGGECPRGRRFMCVLAPGWLEHFFYNEHYATDEEYLFALADAIKHEYKAIVMPVSFFRLMTRPTGYLRHDRAGAGHRGISKVCSGANRGGESCAAGHPEDRVCYHICWGSWHGPHTHDLPLKHVIDLMLRVKAGAYSVEAANPRHEHDGRSGKNQVAGRQDPDSRRRQSRQ